MKPQRYYIKKDVTIDDLYKLGFEDCRKSVYPKAIVRGNLKINIDKKSINVWSGEDINNSMQVWAFRPNSETSKTCNAEFVTPLITDLLTLNIVELR